MKIRYHLDNILVGIGIFAFLALILGMFMGFAVLLTNGHPIWASLVFSPIILSVAWIFGAIAKSW